MPLPRVLVTGASGFVGRHLVEHLKDDYRIVCIARRSQRLNEYQHAFPSAIVRLPARVSD
jgi:nucleoside-diphosphate-sugar epimerase